MQGIAPGKDGVTWWSIRFDYHKMCGIHQLEQIFYKELLQTGLEIVRRAVLRFSNSPLLENVFSACKNASFTSRLSLERFLVKNIPFGILGYVVYLLFISVSLSLMHCKFQ